MANDTDRAREAAVLNLQNYIRIRTAQPDVDYDECISFLQGLAAGLGLPVQVVMPYPKKPVLVMTWEGLEPTLPSILLNSHMDVVAVSEENWSHPPFEAQILDGVIYGRGVQDMKSVGIQYIEAVRRLKDRGVRLRRTVHLSFTPDEETGGLKGMGEFVKTEAFKKLNVGFSMTEAYANDSEDFFLVYGERTTWNVKFSFRGKSGHGSLLLPDNNGEKFRYILDKLMDMRAEQKGILASNPKLTAGDVTTVNLTMLSGGIQNNVVPEQLSATFDVRIARSMDLEELENKLTRWCTEAGPGVTYEFLAKGISAPVTKLDDSNPYWLAFKRAADQLKISLSPRIARGSTDNRYLRPLGIPALGFSPMANMTPLGHDNNEALSVDIFMRGIDIYEAIVHAVANV